MTEASISETSQTARDHAEKILRTVFTKRPQYKLISLDWFPDSDTPAINIQICSEVKVALNPQDEKENRQILILGEKPFLEKKSKQAMQSLIDVWGTSPTDDENMRAATRVVATELSNFDKEKGTALASHTLDITLPGCAANRLGEFQRPNLVIIWAHALALREGALDLETVKNAIVPFGADENESKGPSIVSAVA